MTDITWSVAIQAVSFLVFFLVMRRVLFQPVLKHLEERNRALDEMMERAEADRQEATRLQERYADQLASVKDEARSLLEQAAREGEGLRKEIISRAREEGDQLLEKARADIQEERQQAMERFREDLPSLVAEAASRILGRQVPVAEAQKAVDDSLRADD